MSNKCLICNSDNKLLFKTQVLHKYEVGYHCCTNCGFIQTDTPYWLDEAYSSAITSMDIGLVYRNLVYSPQVDHVLKTSFDYNQKFLDYAGGYGLFVRIMRDKGFDFYWDDKYCQNLFAEHFTLDDIGVSTKFEAVTAFEIFEHLVDPLDEITKLFGYADSIIFSTELVPNKPLNSENDWWYFAPEGGQHIAFYTKKSFQFIADKFNCHFYSNGKDLHILTKKKLAKNPLAFTQRTTWDKIVDHLTGILQGTKTNKPAPVYLPSKIGQDVQHIRNIVHNKKAGHK